MNEQLQNALAEIITSALQSAGAAKDFILAEMPDVVQQLLWWKATESALAFLVTTAALAFMAWGWGAKRGIFRRLADAEIADSGVCFFILTFCGIATVVVALIAACAWNLTWLQILIAPKVYLIEYAAELVK